MSRIRIEVDGQTAMDSNVTLRQGELPNMDTLKASLQSASGGQFQPWQLPTIGALSAVLLEANLKQHIPDTTIAVTTRGNGWCLDVDQNG